MKISKLDQKDIEIEELSVQLADMLAVALHFAGIKQEKIPNAIECYLNAIDEVFGDDDGEMGFNEIVSVIKYMQEHNKELFE